MKVEEAVALVRVRGLAMAEAAKINPGSMAAILGLDDEVVERICRRIANVWPANYNCPGQIVVSGRDGAVDGAMRARRNRKARARRPSAHLGGLPLAARRARPRNGFRPALDKVTFGGADGAVHVDSHGADRGRERIAPLLVEQLTAPVRFTQAARR